MQVRVETVVLNKGDEALASYHTSMKLKLQGLQFFSVIKDKEVEKMLFSNENPFSLCTPYSRLYLKRLINAVLFKYFLLG